MQKHFHQNNSKGRENHPRASKVYETSDWRIRFIHFLAVQNIDHSLKVSVVQCTSHHLHYSSATIRESWIPLEILQLELSLLKQCLQFVLTLGCLHHGVFTSNTIINTEGLLYIFECEFIVFGLVLSISVNCNVGYETRCSNCKCYVSHSVILYRMMRWCLPEYIFEMSIVIVILCVWNSRRMSISCECIVNLTMSVSLSHIPLKILTEASKTILTLVMVLDYL